MKGINFKCLKLFFIIFIVLFLSFSFANANLVDTGDDTVVILNDNNGDSVLDEDVDDDVDDDNQESINVYEGRRGFFSNFLSMVSSWFSGNENNRYRTATSQSCFLWTPNKNSVCIGVSFNQTNECGQNRTVLGTKGCSTSSLHESRRGEGINTDTNPTPTPGPSTQTPITSNTDADTVSGTTDAGTVSGTDTSCTPNCPSPRFVCAGVTNTNPDGCGGTCNVVGTYPGYISRMCVYVNSFGDNIYPYNSCTNRIDINNPIETCQYGCDSQTDRCNVMCEYEGVTRSPGGKLLIFRSGPNNYCNQYTIYTCGNDSNWNKPISPGGYTSCEMNCDYFWTDTGASSGSKLGYPDCPGGDTVLPARNSECFKSRYQDNIRKCVERYDGREFHFDAMHCTRTCNAATLNVATLS